MASSEANRLQTHDDWLICTACGTQFPTSDYQVLTTCFICDDPRQFTPPTGQAFTTLAELRKNHKNEFTPVPGVGADVTNICTIPKFAIGERAMLIRTAGGNVLWDCITLLDEETVARIKALGGIDAMVISHPHYYTTHCEWARAFNCPVYLSLEDKQWTTQSSSHQTWLEGIDTDIPLRPSAQNPSGIKAIKLGGHFPGSLVLLDQTSQCLFIADTLVTTPSGRGSWETDAIGNSRNRPPGMNSFAFMWSIPNMIPLSGEEVFRMWSILKNYDFKSTHGAFVETDIIDPDGIKKRIKDSMIIQMKYSGWMDLSKWN